MHSNLNVTDTHTHEEIILQDEASPTYYDNGFKQLCLETKQQK